MKTLKQVLLDIPYRLTEIEYLPDALFFGGNPVCRIENPTFDLSKKGE